MTTYFFTGATGFLGSHILAQLFSIHQANEIQVKALKRPSSQIPTRLQSLPIEWIDGDLLDVIFLEEIIKDVQIIVHAAAKVSFQAKDRKEMREVNVVGTENLVNAALQAKINCFCHVSSVAALGMALPSEDKITENARWTPEYTEFTAYAFTKHLAEREVWRAQAEGLNVLIVNPSFVLGYEENFRSSTALIDYLLQEKPYYGSGWSNFVDVRDVAELTVQLLQRPDLYNERYILNADTVPFSELMPTLSRALGKKPPHKPIPKWIERFGWRLINVGAKLIGKDTIITKDSLEAARRKVSYSNQKIKEKLGTDFRSLSETAAFIAEQIKTDLS